MTYKAITDDKRRGIGRPGQRAKSLILEENIYSSSGQIPVGLSLAPSLAFRYGFATATLFEERLAIYLRPRGASWPRGSCIAWP
jgi:hypothetical protein